MPANEAINISYNRTTLSVGLRSWLEGNAFVDTNFTNIQRGMLFTYNRSVDIYKCPSDKSTVKDLGQIPRTRSVSMNMYMNVRPDPDDSDYRKCWHKLAQVQRPAPAKAIVFIDENEKSIQQSAFGINAPDHWWLFGTDLWTWISFPATRHNNGCSFTFADGHAEAWHWIEPRTASISSMNTWTVLKPGVSGGDRDLSRLFRGVPEKVPLL
jgi:prepilin-type processing-associated H-X9-DG protein